MLDPDSWKLEEGSPKAQISGEYTEITASVAFGTAYTPADAPAEILLTVRLHATGGSEARIAIDVDGTTVATPAMDTASGGLAGNPDAIQLESLSLTVPEGSSFTVRNVADPAGTNTIESVHKLPL